MLNMKPVTYLWYIIILLIDNVITDPINGDLKIACWHASSYYEYYSSFDLTFCGTIEHVLLKLERPFTADTKNWVSNTGHKEDQAVFVMHPQYATSCWWTRAWWKTAICCSEYNDWLDGSNFVREQFVSAFIFWMNGSHRESYNLSNLLFWACLV